MTIRIGTRGSKLALAQTKLVIARLNNELPQARCEIVVIKTKGDRIQDRPLSEIGGAGVFAGDVETALKSGEIDIAVHSAKDLPTQLGEGLEVRCALKRGDVRDVLVTRAGDDTPCGRPMRIGTGSIRRRAAHAKMFPNISAEYLDIRGNVDTRLEKLKKGDYDGIILAAAGLERLGLLNGAEGVDIKLLAADKFLPAPCQGIIAVESRIGELGRELEAVNDNDTLVCYDTERYILTLLGGDCSQPVGAYSRVENGKLYITATKDHVNIADEVSEPADYKAAAERLVRRL